MDRARTLEIPRRFMRSGVPDEAWEEESAAWSIEYMSRQVGLADLEDTELLDVGCGIKFTRLFVNEGIPIKRYVGVDVYREMIEFLRANVDDPRFEYFHVDVRNELYNPAGDPFSEDLRLPFGERTFDLICLFSVFTHLPPDDYRTMLRVLRPHVRPNGKLFLSLYIDDITEGGHGLMDAYSRLLESDPRILESAAGAVDADGRRRVERFRELVPTRPGLQALYSEGYARELIDESGWKVVKLSPPDRYIQHNFVCEPA